MFLFVPSSKLNFSRSKRKNRKCILTIYFQHILQDVKTPEPTFVIFGYDQNSLRIAVYLCDTKLFFT